VRRFQDERATPGELLHIDAKKLGRIAVGVVGHRLTGDRATCGPRGPTGWEHLPVAVDDAARVASAGPHTAHGRLPPMTRLHA
jgi:hypothetical protein